LVFRFSKLYVKDLRTKPGIQDYKFNFTVFISYCLNYLKKKFTILGLDWFLPALIGVICLAYYTPGTAMFHHPISLAEITNYGITGIFFFYGLKLNPGKFKTGLANWRMHLVIQTTTFLLFPILALAIRPFFNTPGSEHLWSGIFFLAALPSTVSTSVVMVSLAGGNIPAAIFNASISALIGIFITPLWVSLFLQNGSHMDTLNIVLKLVLQVLLPVAIGMLLNKRFGFLTEKYKNALKIFDQVVILLIVYNSFRKSFAEHLFSGMSYVELFFLTLGMLVLFLVVMLLIKFISGFLKFNREDTITALFCGSKKSLVQGTVMSGILFTGSPLAGIILLPILLYHALQLIAASFLARRIALSLKPPD